MNRRLLFALPFVLASLAVSSARSEIVLGSTSIDFGYAKVFSFATRSFWLVNGFATPVIVSVTSDNSPFTAQPAVSSVAPGDTAWIDVRFAPPNESEFFATLSVIKLYPAPAETSFVSVTGKGTTLSIATIEVSPDSLAVDLGPPGTTEQPLTITNVGMEPVSMTFGVDPPSTWLTIGEDALFLAGGQSHELTLGIDATGLGAGHHISGVRILVESVNQPFVDVPVDLLVVPAQMEIAPDTMNVCLCAGEDSTLSASISNAAGLGTVNWSIDVIGQAPPKPLADFDVLYDMSRGGADADFLSLLEAAGANVVRNNSFPITTAMVTPYDVLIVPQRSPFPYTSQEMYDIMFAVRAGTGLLVLGCGTDDTDLDGTNSLVNIVGGGLSFVDTGASDPDGIISTAIAPHQSTNGINSIYLDARQRFVARPPSTPAAELVFRSDGGLLAVAAGGVSMARVALSTSALHEFPGSVSVDNNAFLVQLVEWLGQPLGWVQPTNWIGQNIDADAVDDPVVVSAFAVPPGSYGAALRFRTNDAMVNGLPFELTVLLDVKSCPTTPTRLVSASAVFADGAVRLAYELRDRAEGERIEVYRAEAGGAWRLLVGDLSPTTANIYVYDDATVEAGKTYQYKLVSREGSVVTELNMSEVRVPAGTLALAQNVPNPFKPATSISFYLPAPRDVELTVYDVRGARVRTLVAGPKKSGWNESIWDGTDGAGHRVGAGVYFYRLRAGSHALTKKMVVLR